MLPPVKPNSFAHVRQTVVAGAVLLLLAASAALYAAPPSGQPASPAAWPPQQWAAALQQSSWLLQLRQQLQAQPQQAERALPPPDLEAPVRLTGRVAKRGPYAALTRLAAGESQHSLAFPPAWTQARLAAAAEGVAPPPPPARWTAVMFNDKYKLIYLKCPKTGGTTLIANYFTECFDGVLNGDRCLRMYAASNATQVRHLLDSWQDYFVFGFARNVLARAISQYQYLTHYMGPGCPLVSWDDFCADPFTLGDACFAAAAAGKRCCDPVSALHQYVHAAPQAHCFATVDGAPAVDWLGRVEHLEEDFDALLELLNARPGVPQLPPRPPAWDKANFHNSTCTPSSAAGGGGSSSDGGGAAAEQGRRRLRQLHRGTVWQAREGTFLPCDELDYFRGEHAHCHADLLSFFAEDVAFLQLQDQ